MWEMKRISLLAASERPFSLPIPLEGDSMRPLGSLGRPWYLTDIWATTGSWLLHLALRVLMSPFVRVIWVGGGH